MLQNSRLKIREAVAYFCGAMESGNHYKNGASPKSHKSRIFLSIVVALLLFVPVVSILAQEDSPTAVDPTTTSEQVVVETPEEAVPAPPAPAKVGFFTQFLNDLKEFILLLFVLVAPLFMIGHMIYVLWDTKRLQDPILVDSFVSAREKKGLSRQMIEGQDGQDGNECNQLLDEAWDLYTGVAADEEGNEYRAPAKMKELLKVHKIVKQVEKSMPTDEATIVKLNEHRAFLYSYMQRSFFSSWKLIILGVIVAIGASFLDGTENFWKMFFTLGAFFWIPCIVYWLSGNVTQYMIDKKAQRGGGGGWFVAALVGIGLGVLFSGQTVRTRYTDGSYEDDNSSHWIALALGVIVLVIVACTIYIWSVVNYLRNYVLYV